MAQGTVQDDGLPGFSGMKTKEELGILVLDGSGSMGEVGLSGQSKGLEVQTAVRELVCRIQAGRKKNQIELAIVSFCNLVNKDRLPPTPVLNCDPTGNYNPLDGHGGATAIGDALATAHQVAEAYLAQQNQYPRSVVIVLMTDGQQCHGSDPRQVAQQIKANNRIKIATCAFGKDADDSLMKELATSLDLYLHAYNVEQLRNFFIASLSKVDTKAPTAASV
jgi:uncharacterized protein YegL